MTKQFIRGVLATINGVEVGSSGDNGLRIVFGVRQGLVGTPHNASIVIFNPAPQTIARMRKEKGRVELRAGYRDGGTKLIFRGEALQVRNGRENVTDTYVHVIATSGEDARNYATVNKALAAGHTYRDRIDLAAAAFRKHGVGVGHIDDLGKRKFSRNFVHCGMAHDLLQETCRAMNASWFVQGDKLNVLKSENVLPGTGAHVINADTGMVGLPEQTIEGVIVRCLLNPDVLPGHQVKLDNASIQQAQFDPSTGAAAQNQLFQDGKPLALSADGTYKVWRVEHEGDTRGLAFYSTITGTEREQPTALGGLLGVPSEVDQPQDR